MSSFAGTRSAHCSGKKDVTGGARAAIFPIARIGIRDPSATADSPTDVWTDAIAFDREGVIGVGYINIFNSSEI